MSSILKSIIVLVLLFFSVPAAACFGPKLYVGTSPGAGGELLFHLASIYIKEKTGVESIRVEYNGEENAQLLLLQEKIDFGFAARANEVWPHLLQIGDRQFLLHGPRPVSDLQFTTVPKALKRLQKLLTAEDLNLLEQQVSEGLLPAKAVRQLYMQRGWI